MPNAQDPKPPESIALRAFSILEHVVRASGPVSLEEATQLCGLPKPTTFRILNLLESADLLRRDTATKRYTPGSRLTTLALDMWRQTTLRAQWHRALQDAVDAIGESCNLTILEGDQVLYLDRVETPMPLRLHLEPGTRVPLHCTASGKLFLSQMTPAEVRRLLGARRLERFTPKTITSLDVLEKELAKVRETGVGTHDSELFADSVAIAVPVRDRLGRIYAAIAVHAPESRMSIKSSMKHLPVLRQAAALIAQSMTPGSQTQDVRPVERSARRSTAARQRR